MQPDDELPQTLAYFILSKLRWRIISGDLQPGQPLREMEIQSHYGSSRGPVRESLRLLLRSGLVEHQQRRGFRVREYSPDDIRNIYTLRRTLEGMVVSDLEGRETATLVQVLDGRLQLMEVCFENKDIDGYFRRTASSTRRSSTSPGTSRSPRSCTTSTRSPCRCATA